MQFIAIGQNYTGGQSPFGRHEASGAMGPLGCHPLVNGGSSPFGPSPMFDPWQPRGYSVPGMWSCDNPFSSPGHFNGMPNDTERRYRMQPESDGTLNHGYGNSYVYRSGQGPYPGGPLTTSSEVWT